MIQPNYREKVESALQATVIHTPVVYSWFGKLSPKLSPTMRRALNPETARSYLLLILQSQLYRDFYCLGEASQANEYDFQTSGTSGVTPFVERLSKANSGSGFWSEGWALCNQENGAFELSRGGMRIKVNKYDALSRSKDSLTAGMVMSLRFPKEYLGLSPGYYMALSNVEFPLDEAQSTTRLYLNFHPETAVRFLELTTRTFNEANLPFRLKVLNDPDRFTRCDNVVLYTRKEDFTAVAETLQEIYPQVYSGLRKSLPAFTRPMAVGIGFAEDPGSGESFGLNRCRLLAEGIIRAYEQGQDKMPERIAAVEACFLEEGIDLDQPYLNPGSSDDYSLHLGPSYWQRDTMNVRAAENEPVGKNDFLNTACQIGAQIKDSAIWYHECCNWLGSLPSERNPRQSPFHSVYGALGSDLYGGTSGIALFLAELYTMTGDVNFQRVAFGAIRQAISGAESAQSQKRIGLFTGWPGIALACVRVGILLGEEEIWERARHVLQQSIRNPRMEGKFDLISGRAGAIVAILALKEFFNDPPLLDYAISMGDELIQSADKSATGYSWKSHAASYSNNLTGFSHGAAGIGWALVELFSFTGDPKYRHAAERAFQYERHWFSSKEGNWPDFREESTGYKPRNRPAVHSYATTWCHGAPGIALSRLRSFGILQDERYKAEAETALKTTRKAVEASLQAQGGNFSLCHGLAGNCDILEYGSHMLDRRQLEDSTLVQKIAQLGVRNYGSNHHWPCGTGFGETPNLMLGLAGIGLFYLRLYDPAVPTVLMIHPESFLKTHSPL